VQGLANRAWGYAHRKGGEEGKRVISFSLLIRKETGFEEKDRKKKEGKKGKGRSERVALSSSD